MPTRPLPPRPHVSRPVLWVAVVLACAVLGAVAAPALGGTAPDAPDGAAEERDGNEATGPDGQGGGDLGIPPGGDPLQGERLYAQHCARCHGPAGGGTDLAPSLQTVDVALFDLVLRTNRMPPATDTGRGRGPVEWTDEERLDLLAYAARALNLTGSIPSPEPGDPTVGRRLYAKNCAACHGYTGDGGVAGGGAFTPRVVGQEAVTIAEAIRVGPFQMPRFGEFQVPEGGLGDVAAYLESVSEEEATPLLQQGELNPVYASAFAAVFALIVLVSCVWLGGRVIMFPDPTSSPDEDGQPGTPGDGTHGGQHTESADDAEAGQDRADDEEGGQR